MTATLDIPVSLAISMLRKAGTGDSLLSALDAIVSTNETEVMDDVDVTEPTEWVNAASLDDEGSVITTIELN